MINSFKFTILLLFGFATFSCSPKNHKSTITTANIEKSCIDRVISADNALGSARNHNCEVMSLSETIKLYTDGIDKIDFKDCPADFTKAFDDHKKAWVEMLTITDKYPDLRGEMHDLFKILEEGKDKASFDPLLATIWSTWADVEKSMEQSK